TGERADRGREGGTGVGPGRGDHSRSEGGGVQPVLRRTDPVGVDRLYVRRVGLAAPLEQEALGGGLPGLDGGAVDGRRVPVRDARRLRDDVERRGRQAPQILRRLLVGDVDQLAELPLRRQRGQRRLQVSGRVAGQALRR